ncbi:hypothetical protein OKA05_06555 [Luteolibacter arcticus]|uniref:Uncharacterized protein n=1 Tax=Luteolibacter arcticus TaxID=1581411 RepID=A0ABT3GFG9_9BACT|nr:hypothetical protein [Luteolibacter arcticus]MCW1922206.1 hypothetical protein [Luteolibacter arcticus]
MNVTPSAFRRTIYPTLCLSLPGLVAVCSLFFGLSGALQSSAYYQVQIALGYAAMILVIELVGVPLRTRLWHFWAGIPFSVFLFTVGVFAGCAASMLVYPDVDFVPHVFAPFFLISVYGFLPATVFGVIGTLILRGITPRAPHLEP